MQDTETFNGWTNWDTWNANMWLNSDEDVYTAALFCAQNFPVDIFAEECKVYLVRVIDNINWVYSDDLDPENVNWVEIYDAFLVVGH